jgi:hypothetical protein
VDLGVDVAANTPVRWLAEFTGAAEAAAMGVAVSVEVSPSNGIWPAAPLSVFWVNGPRVARVKVFDYDPATRRFSPLATAAARTSIVTDPALMISLLGVSALTAAGGVLNLGEVREGAGPAVPEGPWLEFCIGPERVASLSQAGRLYASSVTETPPAVLTPDYRDYFRRFEFWSAGALTAVLSAAGLTATAIREGS